MGTTRLSQLATHTTMESIRRGVVNNGALLVSLASAAIIATSFASGEASAATEEIAVSGKGRGGENGDPPATPAGGAPAAGIGVAGSSGLAIFVGVLAAVVAGDGDREASGTTGTTTTAAPR